MKIIIYTKENIYNFKSDNDKDYNFALEHANRKDGPAVIWYYENDNKQYESWYINGKLNRENGPAEILYSIDGYKAIEKWYLNGKKYSVDKFSQEILKRKLQLI